MIIRSLLIVLVAFTSGNIFAGPNPFETLQDDFQKANMPAQKEALGYWAGHCIHSHDPETRWPAVYVSKTILDSNSNIEKISQTYFWEKRNDAAFFLGLSVQQLNQYGPFMSWIQKEQWTSTEMINNSLTNTFNLPSGGTILRSLRVDETEFTRTYLMQVSRKTEKNNEVISYCAFSTEMMSATPDENIPTFSVHTGVIGNTFADIRLPFQQRAMKSLVIKKRMGEAITLSSIEVLREDGKTMYFAPVAFEKGESVGLIDKYALPFRAVAVRFYVSGLASDLEIYGSLR